MMIIFHGPLLLMARGIRWFWRGRLMGKVTRVLGKQVIRSEDLQALVIRFHPMIWIKFL